LAELVRAEETAKDTDPLRVARATAALHEAESACEAGDTAQGLSIYDTVFDVLHGLEGSLDRTASYFD
jgi:hypothetical protein